MSAVIHPISLQLGLRPANQQPRIDPRERWQRRSPRIKPCTRTPANRVIDSRSRSMITRMLVSADDLAATRGLGRDSIYMSRPGSSCARGDPVSGFSIPHSRRTVSSPAAARKLPVFPPFNTFKPATRKIVTATVQKAASVAAIFFPPACPRS